MPFDDCRFIFISFSLTEVGGGQSGHQTSVSKLKFEVNFKIGGGHNLKVTFFSLTRRESKIWPLFVHDLPLSKC